MSGISLKKEEKRIPVILFLGAGASFSSGVRTANNLKDKVLDELYTKSKDWDDLRTKYYNNPSKGIQDLADDLKTPSTRYAFKDAIARNLYSRSPIISPEYRMLAFLIKKKLVDAVYTTNQDVCLERALDSQGILYNRYVYPYTVKEVQSKANGNVDIFKLCGDVHTPYEMCFSEAELQNASESPLFKKLISYFTQKCRIIFIGYSATDDPIGRSLCTASEDRQNCSTPATLYVVDIWKQTGHDKLIKEDYGDCFIEKTAEKYLTDEILEIKPNIDVKHALVSTEGFGGIQTYAYSLMELQREFGINVTTSTYATRTFYNNSNSKEKRAYGFSYDLASSKSETVKAICIDHPDVIHAHNFIAAHMAQTLGVPCVFTSHSLESKEMDVLGKKIFASLASPEDPFAKNISKYEDLYYRQLPTILALSEAHIQELHEDVRPSTKLVAAPFLKPEWLGITTNVTSREKREEINKRCSSLKCIMNNGNGNGKLAEDTKTIAFFGRPDLRKGLYVFDRAIEILHSRNSNSDSNKNFQVLYVGPRIVVKANKLYIEEERTSYGQSYYGLYKDGREVDPDLQKRMFVITETLVDDSCILFKEHLKKMYDYYLASDVVVIPSSYETFGYVALEAMACRRPVVASNIDGLNYLLGDGRGTLIDIEDDGNDADQKVETMAQNIADAIEKILDNGAKDQIEKAKAWVDQTYSYKNIEELVHVMYGYYLDSIIHERKSVGGDPKEIASKLAELFGSTEEWDDLLTISSNAYQELRQIIYPSSTECTEFYGLFWHIAYWLKVNKSTCPEVSMLPTRELAELITDVTRYMHKNTSTNESSENEETHQQDLTI